LNDSQSVEIFGNTLTNNANGIGFTQTERGTTVLGDLVTQNNSIHDNTLVHSGRTGIVDWDQNLSYNQNNHFTHNSFNVCGDSTPFIWKDPSNPNSYAPVTWGQWRSAENDTTGSYGCS
jgi:hypothetical protein